MTKQAVERKAVRLHLTNIAGLGAVQLLQSLLPNFERLPGYKLEAIFLPSRGELSNYETACHETKLICYKRYLPNSISRLLECTLFGSKFDGATPLLVLGDIPVRTKTKQTVFVQTTLLTDGASTGRQLGAIKYWIARWLFRLNIDYVSAFIVQTEAMKAALIETYPKIRERVRVIAQPAPSWLLESQLKRTQKNIRTDSGLRLFYPAAVYPHKNHQLLGAIRADQANTWPVSELLLTIPENLNPSPAIAWIHCVDRLAPNKVIKAYENADALLFLSLSESFGFPLVEAMWIGLPIICPDLPYARTLCGNQAIYFNPEDVNSLYVAIVDLSKRLDSGWWPEWSENLKGIPRNWTEVAAAMLSLATDEGEAA
ncbi:MAG: glycosyltransferase [Methylobacter sp.]|nr:glycosyltransferase [Methylobacter sp.]